MIGFFSGTRCSCLEEVDDHPSRGHSTVRLVFLSGYVGTGMLQKGLFEKLRLTRASLTAQNFFKLFSSYKIVVMVVAPTTGTQVWN